MSNRVTLVVVSMLLAAPSAFALNARSAVSVNGNDLNSCTVASPCRSFNRAIGITTAGGEVIALDSAGYGPFTITGSLTVSGAPGIHAAITVPDDGLGTGTGITVNTSATDHVTLRNLVLIDGGGVTGIKQVRAAELRVLNCMIRGFGEGIWVKAGRLAVDHSMVLDSSSPVLEYGMGVDLDSNGTDVIEMTLDNSLIEGNDIGVSVSGHSSAMITSCTISGNYPWGVVVSSTVGTGSVPARATLESTTVAYNPVGIYANAFNSNTAFVFLSQDEISYNSVQAILIGNGQSVFYTFNNNRFTGNTVDGSPLTPIAFK